MAPNLSDRMPFPGDSNCVRKRASTDLPEEARLDWPVVNDVLADERLLLLAAQADLRQASYDAYPCSADPSSNLKNEYPSAKAANVAIEEKTLRTLTKFCLIAIITLLLIFASI